MRRLSATLVSIAGLAGCYTETYVEPYAGV